MKKFALSLLLGAFAAVSGTAAPLSFSTSFSGNAIGLPSAAGDTEVVFSTFAPGPPLCSISCSGVSFDTGNLLTSGQVEIFTFNTTGTDVVFTSDGGSWTVTSDGSGGLAVLLLGTYSRGVDSSAGYLKFTYQSSGVPVDEADIDINDIQGINEITQFSAAGTTVPEPGSMALLGSGLVGLGMLARRRRK